ncbi:DUF7123 family protein [Halobacterium hubeiense]|uniref:DUF7123 family protein n=1 Tax=Halobacterium hubeiense TaxID=1407499 RepID=UPI003C71C406
MPLSRKVDNDDVTSIDVSEASYSALQDRILQYLDAETTEGRLFVKSRHIATALDASVKRIGVAMVDLEARTTEFEFERWGGSSDGVTWVVTRLTGEK